MADIDLIRHGESTSNAGEPTQDVTAAPLTGKGRAQADDISRRFTEAPDLIVITPHLRTRQTAEPTIARFPDVPVEVWPLQEFAGLCDAKYNGTTVDQRRPFMKEYWDRADPDFVDGPGAESFNNMLNRLRDGCKRMQAARGHVVIFAHGYIIQAMRFLLTRPDMSAKDMMKAMAEYHARLPVLNGTTVRLHADASGVRLQDDDRKTFESGFLPTGLPPQPKHTDFMPDM